VLDHLHRMAERRIQAEQSRTTLGAGRISYPVQTSKGAANLK